MSEQLENHFCIMCVKNLQKIEVFCTDSDVPPYLKAAFNNVLGTSLQSQTKAQQPESEALHSIWSTAFLQTGL